MTRFLEAIGVTLVVVSLLAAISMALIDHPGSRSEREIGNFQEGSGPAANLGLGALFGAGVGARPDTSWRHLALECIVL
jgi:hypothetical protein